MRAESVVDGGELLVSMAGFRARNCEPARRICRAADVRAFVVEGFSVG